MSDAAYDLEAVANRHIADFNRKRAAKIREMDLRTLLKKKNPYLFIAERVETPETLAEALVRAALSSSDETMFGNALENIAVDICSAVYGGSKSPATGIDLDFEREGVRYLVAIKSGPNWGNSSQVAKLRQDFKQAIRVARQGNPHLNIQAINGCCYGTVNRDYGDYRKMCGRVFWELISGDDLLFSRLAGAIGRASANGYRTQIAEAIDRITGQLRADWSEDGLINWNSVIALNAAQPSR